MAEVPGQREGIAQKLPPFRAPRLLKAPQDLLLDLGTKALYLPDLSLLGGPLQVLQGAHTQGLVQKLGGFGTDTLDLGQGVKVHGQFRLEFLVEG